jgi:outer membrane protein assembly factor BamD (BamD/ComL family)
VAYRRKGLDAQATAEFNAVLDTWPVSEYARRAKAALEQGRHKSTPPPDDSSAA